MPRKPRIHVPGAVYHVILRGNARQDIFADDRDRFRLYQILRKGSKRFRHRILAFCLMTNHLHLAMQVAEISLSRIMQNVSQQYTQWFNWRYNKCGHVFQGRYKAVMVDADSYLLELAAYIHLNPVRAGICSEPGTYRWSSHNVYVGQEKIPWVQVTPVLAQFSDNLGEARAKFAAFVDERSAQERKPEFHGEKTADYRVFGSDAFIEEVLNRTESMPPSKPTVADVLDAVTTLYGISLAELAAPGQRRGPSEARSLAAWATHELSDGTLGELARRLNRDPATISCAVRRIEEMLNQNPQLAEKAEKLRWDLWKVQIFTA